MISWLHPLKIWSLRVSSKPGRFTIGNIYQSDSQSVLRDPLQTLQRGTKAGLRAQRWGAQQGTLRSQLGFNSSFIERLCWLARWRQALPRIILLRVLDRRLAQPLIG